MRFLVVPLTFLWSVSASAQALETVIQKGHELAVISVAVSPDSNYVATGSRDKTAKLWELSTGREVRSFLGHQASVNGVDFSTDGKFLITSSGDKTARIWEVETGREIYQTPAQEDYVTDVNFSPDNSYFMVGGFSDTLQIVDSKSKKTIAGIPVDPDKSRGYGTQFAVSADGKWIATGEDNRKANVYRTTDWQRQHSFTFEEGWCGGCMTLVAFTPDSHSLIMASYKGTVKKYNLASGQLTTRYQEDVGDLSALAISPNGKMVMIATKTEIFVWDVDSGKELYKIAPGLAEDINETVFTLDSRKLIVTCNDNTAMIWDLATRKPVGRLTGFLNQRDKGGLTYDQDDYWDSGIAKYVRFKNHLMLGPGGTELIKGKFGTKVKRWDIATGKTIMEYTGHAKAVLCYDLSRDGKRMVTGGGDGKMMLWDLQTGDSLQSIQSYRHPILDIHFSQDETQIITSSWDATVKIHDLKSKKLLHYFEFNEGGSAYNVIWSPGDLYVFTSQGNILKMWETDTQAPVRDFIGHQDLISSLHISPDGRSLLSSSWDGSIRLWDIGTGLMSRKFKGHQGAVHISIFSPDGNLIYSAGADRSIRVWDIATAQVVRTFDGHLAEITSLLLSPDNKMLISHSVDGATKFWDLNSGKEFFEHIHFGEKEWMVKNPEGYFNGTQDARRYIHFVNGMKTYSVDQFFEEFYRPDLLPRIFQNRGGREERPAIQGKIQKSPPPVVKIAALQSTDAGRADIYVKLTDTGSGVESLKLFHNGKNIPLNRGELKYPKGKDQSTTYRGSVTLVGGNNTFTATALNSDNVESDQVSTELISEVAGKTSTCFVLSVGINQYKNPKMTLNYALSDAQSFGKVMNEKATRLYRHVEVHTLFDEQASRVNILKMLDDLASKIQQEDVFIFYYAGHGSMVDNQFFFVPAESSRLYDLSSLQKDAIEAGVLQEKFKNIKALKQLIVMDACQSGGSVELLATRGAAEEKAIAQLSRSAGIHVMASAGSEQFATEFAELGHGLFTYLLIKAMEGEADGAPKDGKVTIYELKSYLDDQVPEITRKLKGKPQYPYTFSRGQDFPVVLEE